MRLGWHRWTRLTLAAVGAIGTASLATTAAAAGIGVAGASPEAGLSIDAAKGALSVRFVAVSVGFSGPVVSYRWNFGDGASATTSTEVVTHRYRSAGRFAAAVTETDKQGQHAVARGTVALFRCKAGEATCRVALPDTANVALLAASGRQGPAGPASATLFAGPFRITACAPGVIRAVAVTDAGFSGDLTVTMRYASAQPKTASTTCFSSAVAFVDAAGHLVHSGDLPRCRAAAKAPCVKSVAIDASTVSKVLLIPPGDPKVGAP
jgi:hypothetical protein